MTQYIPRRIKRLRRNDDPETAHLGAEAAAAHLAENRRAVLEVLRKDGGWMTFVEIEESGVGGRAFDRRCRDLFEAGLVERRPTTRDGCRVEYRYLR